MLLWSTCHLLASFFGEGEVGVWHPSEEGKLWELWERLRGGVRMEERRERSWKRGREIEGSRKWGRRPWREAFSTFETGTRIYFNLVVRNENKNCPGKKIPEIWLNGQKSMARSYEEKQGWGGENMKRRGRKGKRTMGNPYKLTTYNAGKISYLTYIWRKCSLACKLSSYKSFTTVMAICEALIKENFYRKLSSYKLI